MERCVCFTKGVGLLEDARMTAYHVFIENEQTGELCPKAPRTLSEGVVQVDTARK